MQTLEFVCPRQLEIGYVEYMRASQAINIYEIK